MLKEQDICLLPAIDMLLDIFEKEPDYKHFHLDSQTLPIQDYLEIKPQKKEILKKYISEGKLAVGPWFCLPDEFCVGGESLIRNLLLGHKIANEFGKVSKTRLFTVRLGSNITNATAISWLRNRFCVILQRS